MTMLHPIHNNVVPSLSPFQSPHPCPMTLRASLNVIQDKPRKKEKNHPKPQPIRLSGAPARATRNEALWPCDTFSQFMQRHSILSTGIPCEPAVPTQIRTPCGYVQCGSRRRCRACRLVWAPMRSALAREIRGTVTEVR